jgi:hypothetical protein
MKNIMRTAFVFFLTLTAFLFFISLSANAQDNEASKVKKTKDTTGLPLRQISLGSNGVKVCIVDTNKKYKVDKPFKSEYCILDLGFNFLKDNTNYASSAVQNYLHVPSQYQNSNLFGMRESKSINVNFYPYMGAYRFINSKKQKAYVSSGVGFQIYNFRFNKPISYRNDALPYITLDSISFSKNKLAVTYLTIPLNLTFKTKLAKDNWLVYGVGLSTGFRISSWTKQISSELGKQKNHDPFNLNPFNTCITGEIGIDNKVRLYASYQLTSLDKDIMNQHPFCIGIRFGGI